MQASKNDVAFWATTTIAVLSPHLWVNLLFTVISAALLVAGGRTKGQP